MSIGEVNKCYTSENLNSDCNDEKESFALQVGTPLYLYMILLYQTPIDAQCHSGIVSLHECCCTSIRLEVQRETSHNKDSMLGSKIN